MRKISIDRVVLVFTLALLSHMLSLAALHAQDNAGATIENQRTSLTISEAVMCEGIRDYAPVNKAIVFSLNIGKIYCFTSFENIPEKTVIYHNWYRRDKLITTKRLSLQPPKWSTFSSIQLREADKGPWRLEIKDNSKQVLRVLRFSITE